MESVEIGLESVMRHFEELEDPRSEVNLRHPLVSVVVISLMAVLAGAAGPTAIARWAVLKGDELLKVLPLPHGIPRKDVFRRVLGTLQPQAFQVCFVRSDHHDRRDGDSESDRQADRGSQCGLCFGTQGEPEQAA
jgi:hypothetical protein